MIALDLKQIPQLFHDEICVHLVQNPLERAEIGMKFCIVFLQIVRAEKLRQHTQIKVWPISSRSG